MGKISKKEKDEIIKGMRDATMDKLNEMTIPDENDANRMAEQLFLLYHSMTEVGFTKAQAMELVKHVMALGAKI